MVFFQQWYHNNLMNINRYNNNIKNYFNSKHLKKIKLLKYKTYIIHYNKIFKKKKIKIQ